MPPAVNTTQLPSTTLEHIVDAANRHPRDAIPRPILRAVPLSELLRYRLGVLVATEGLSPAALDEGALRKSFSFVQRGLTLTPGA